MSIEKRRKSALSSSISIESIRKSTNSFTDGLKKAQNTASEIIGQTREQNRFKNRLVRNDNEYFEKRRENVRRKDREDELEASGVTGVAKRTGSLVANSTKGFLGRVIDFFAVTLLGFFVFQLPVIIKRLQGLFGLIGKLLSVLRFFTDGISNFLVDIQEGISTAIDRIRGVDFEQEYQKNLKQIEDTTSGIRLLDDDLTQGGLIFSEPGNFGLRDFNIDEDQDIIKPEDVAAEEEQKGKEQNESEEDKNKRLAKEKEQEKEFTNVGASTGEPSSEDKQNDRQSTKKEEGEFIQGINSTIKGEKTLQTKDQLNVEKNIETQQGADENEEGKSLTGKINKFLKNIFGYDPEKKTVVEQPQVAGVDSRDTAEQKLVGKVKEGLNQKPTKNLDDVFNDLNEKIAKLNEEGIMGMPASDITVQKTERGDVKGRKKPKTTIIVKEVPVEMNSGSGTMTSGGDGKINFNGLVNRNNQSNIMKKIQSVILGK